MDRLRTFWKNGVTAMIEELERDIVLIEEDLSFYPKNSFGYAWRELAVKVAELKIEIWKAFI